MMRLGQLLGDALAQSQGTLQSGASEAILWLSRRIRPQEMRELFSSSDLAAKPLKQS